MPIAPHETFVPWLEPRAAYVHIPFCGHHCGYCDFAVAAGQDSLIELYLDALEIELSSLQTSTPLDTLFIGGGTPTYLSANQLERLLRMLQLRLPVRRSPLHSANREFAIESTPESIDSEKVKIMADFGVDRVSIGVQSFKPHLLRALDRRHGAEQTFAAVAAVRELIPYVSLDLIFAAPGQTSADWESDLAEAIAISPDHISTYGLTYEKGTPLWKSREKGEVAALDESDELARYLRAIEILGEAGFEHYEISNFAKPGRQSTHNHVYWANEAYFGFGVGAARYVNGRREHNIRDTKLYIRRVLAGESPTQQSECLEPRDAAFETVATQLRRSRGIDREQFLRRTGFALDSLLGVRLSQLVEFGLVEDTGNGVRLTLRGKCVSDGVIEELMKGNAAHQSPG